MALLITITGIVTKSDGAYVINGCTSDLTPKHVYLIISKSITHIPFILDLAYILPSNRIDFKSIKTLYLRHQKIYDVPITPIRLDPWVLEKINYCHTSSPTYRHLRNLNNILFKARAISKNKDITFSYHFYYFYGVIPLNVLWHPNALNHYKPHPL